MASSMEHLSLLFLLLILSTSSLQTQARESQFFSKAMRDDTPKETKPAPKENPTTNGEEPMTYPPQTQHGYGLYGHGLNQFSPTTTTTNYNNNNGAQYNEFANESSENKESNPGYRAYDNQNSNGNNARYNVDEFTTGSYEKKEANAEYPNYEYTDKQHGMSDTRYMENGKYFYNANAEKHRNGFESTKGNSRAFGSYSGAGARGGSYGYGGYSYGGSDNGYEYNKAIEGYQKNQENQRSQEVYVP